jgi:hypothetical protein
MLRNRLSRLRHCLVFSAAALLAAAGVSRAQQPFPVRSDPQPAAAPAASADDLKAQLEAQQKRIEELEALVRGGQLRPAAGEADKAGDPPKPLDDAAVKKIVADYLKDNPGAGVPSGVQIGSEVNRGFVIRSAPDPKWSNWDDGSKIPFELRIRGRIQADWYYYQPTDSRNHMTGALNTQPAVAGSGSNPAIRGNTSPTFDQLEIKRGRIFFDGNVFDPNLRFRIDMEGNTRGVIGTAGGGLPGTTGLTAVGGLNALPAGVTTSGTPGGNNITLLDHNVRLQGAFIAYDFHPCGYEKGCGPDCPEGYYRYTPTVTAFAGKFKPFFGLEETLLPFNEQFVEWSMASWFFDADDDAWAMMAGFQVHALDDRLYAQAMLTNGNDSGFSNNAQMDDLPSFDGGLWYDFGGTWNDARKRWDLFGDCISDIDYSCHPVLRVGGAANLVPMDRRSEFTNAELNRIRVMPAGPGGTTLLNLLNGGGVNNNTAGVGQFAIDAADEYTFEAYWAAKFRGFSVYNGWWLEDLDNFRGRRQPAGNYPGNGLNAPILYTSGAGTTLFNRRSLMTYGTQLQGGYFILPKKLEICARWCLIRGESGDLNGRPGVAPLTLSTAQKAALGLPTATTIRFIPDAFHNYHDADEYAVGLNYYFYRQQVKWQTDFSVYQGGNPASGGQSPAGFIPGVDGWMVRTQIQLFF